MDGSCHVNSTDVWRVAASNRLVGGNTSIHPVVVVSNNVKPQLLHKTTLWHYLTTITWCSGKFSIEKTFTDFLVWEPPMKLFSTKFGHNTSTYLIAHWCKYVYTWPKSHRINFLMLEFSMLELHPRSLPMAYSTAWWSSSRTVLEHHRSFIPSMLVSQLEEKKPRAATTTNMYTHPECWWGKS